MIQSSVKYQMILFLFLAAHISLAQNQETKPIKMAMMGLSHGHSPWIFDSKHQKDVKLVGIYEPDTGLAKQFEVRYGLDKSLFYTDPAKLLDEIKPEAVLAFGSIYDHLKVVELAAPRGIHVMVEKPLSAYLDHAIQMKTLAEAHGILLLTNFETSWYPSTEKTHEMLQDSAQFGPIRKAVFHHGHKGPKEIGVGPEFLDWLTDPVQNGGGALIDFGCYGANIMTYLMKGQRPVSVTAITNTYKPDLYPEVDDDATIILQYAEAQAILQASWNWPFDRKDMEVYTSMGQVISEDRSQMRWRSWKQMEEMKIKADAEALGVYQDPFAYFADVIRGKIEMPPFGLYALDNNMIVVEILEAARKSAETGKTVFLQKQP